MEEENIDNISVNNENNEVQMNNNVQGEVDTDNIQQIM